jgi:hypothetical protein
MTSHLPSAANNPTLMDFLQSLGPDDSVQELGEILNQTNRLLDDMTFVEGNLITGHRFAIRTGIPEPTWRRYYQGVQPTKSSRAQVTASTGTLEDYAEVDQELADLNGNANSFRLNEDRAHIEGMTQKATRYMLYGDEGVEPNAITGIMPHFNALGDSGTGDQIIDAGGTGTDNGSILLIGWAPHTIFGIYPKGSKAGLEMNDKGQVTAEAKTADGTKIGLYEAYRTHYRWQLGLVIQDYRYIVRIANIDRSLLAPDITLTSNLGANLPDLMFQAMEYLPTLDGVRPVFYMDRNMLTMLRRQMPYAVKNSTLTMEDVGGRRLYDFQGVPIQRIDQMRVDEARVVAA